MSQPGVMVISQDFERRWGVRDHSPLGGLYERNILGEAQSIPAMLEAFRSHDVSVTWATVGMLMAQSLSEWQDVRPRVLPAYERAGLNPYLEPPGADEEQDLVHFGSHLLDQIKATPKQEIGTHTFSHYYCLEPGQTEETFRADLDSAKKIAERTGVRLDSIVFPRNQVNRAYLKILLEYGIRNYRGNQKRWYYNATRGNEQNLLVRGFRFLEPYVPLFSDNLQSWSEVLEPDGLANVRASYFLRPWSARLRWLEGLKVWRLKSDMRRAAKERKIFHLWWHPHNFGVHLRENMRILEQILDEYTLLRRKYGMCSLSMGDVGKLARGEG